MALHDPVPDDDLLPPELALEDDYPEPFDVESRIDELVDPALRAVPEAEPDPWAIADDQAAEWAMRHLARAEAELAELTVQRDRWTAKIDGWFDRVTKRARARRDLFESHLRQWALQRRTESGGRVKSIELPSGRVSTRAGTKAQVIVQDSEAFLAWAEENLDAGTYEAVVKTERSVRLTDLRKVVGIDAEHGVPIFEGSGDVELVPGLAIAEPADDTASVQVDR